MDWDYIVMKITDVFMIIAMSVVALGFLLIFILLTFYMFA